jgi:hypothetical protein
VTSLLPIPGPRLQSTPNGVVVFTPEPIWSYSAGLAVPEDLRRTYPQKRAYVRVRGIVRSGTVGFGVLPADRGPWVGTANVSKTGKPFDVYVPVPVLGNTSDFMVMNWDRGGAGVVEINSLTLYLVAD